MRQRYFQLTGMDFSTKENQLSLQQIIALRFAGDDEILALIDKSIQDNTPSKEIKKSIKHWNPDYNRV